MAGYSILKTNFSSPDSEFLLDNLKLLGFSGFQFSETFKALCPLNRLSPPPSVRTQFNLWVRCWYKEQINFEFSVARPVWPFRWLTTVNFFFQRYSNTVRICTFFYTIDTYLVKKISVCQNAAPQTKFVWRCKKGIEWGYSDEMNCNTPALSIYHGWIETWLRQN